MVPILSDCTGTPREEVSPFAVEFDGRLGETLEEGIDLGHGGVPRGPLKPMNEPDAYHQHAQLAVSIWKAPLNPIPDFRAAAAKGSKVRSTDRAAEVQFLATRVCEPGDDLCAFDVFAPDAFGGDAGVIFGRKARSFADKAQTHTGVHVIGF